MKGGMGGTSWKIPSSRSWSFLFGSGVTAAIFSSAVSQICNIPVCDFIFFLSIFLLKCYLITFHQDVSEKSCFSSHLSIFLKLRFFQSTPPLIRHCVSVKFDLHLLWRNVNYMQKISEVMLQVGLFIVRVKLCWCLRWCEAGGLLLFIVNSILTMFALYYLLYLSRNMLCDRSDSMNYVQDATDISNLLVFAH